MTVGIAAIAEGGDLPRVVFSADRMVTVGQTTGIEYENTDSKLETILDAGGMVVMGVGSGSLSLIDSVMDRLESRMASNPPGSISELVDLARKSYQSMERDTINNQTLSTFEISLNEITNPDVDIPDQFQEAMINDIANIRTQIRENVNILVGGVDSEGPKLFTVSFSDFTSFTNTGYAVIGSGSESAQLSFIRNRYDADEASLTEAVFSVAEAKIQAEERQGVGHEMDMAIVDENGVRQIMDIDRLRELYSEVQDEQEEARKRVMDKWEEPTG